MDLFFMIQITLLFYDTITLHCVKNSKYSTALQQYVHMRMYNYVSTV